MKAIILTRLVPVLTAIALMLNSVGAMIGVGVIIPYNPDRVEVAVEGEISTNVDEILGYYNEAVKKTGFVIGRSSYSDFILDFNLGEDPDEYDQIILDTLDTLKEYITSTETYFFEAPGNGGVLAADVESAKMSVKDGKRTIILELVDGEEVAERLFAWEDVDVLESFAEMGLNVDDAAISEYYGDITVSCVIDENGKIIYGDWDYGCEFDVDNVVMKMGDEENVIDFSMVATIEGDI